MRPALRYTLLGDGTSDAALVSVIAWLLRQHLPPATAVEQGQVADLSRLPSALRPPLSDLGGRVRIAMDFYPCDVLFVHRDAERQNAYLGRREKIRDAISQLPLDIPVIPVIPVRMTEAWLLHDEAALRLAAGRPQGKTPLGLPSNEQVERIHAKNRLFQLLKEASGLSGRKAKRFSLPGARYRLATLIDDYAPLRSFESFRDLERDVQAFCVSWAEASSD